MLARIMAASVHVEPYARMVAGDILLARDEPTAGDLAMVCDVMQLDARVLFVSFDECAGGVDDLPGVYADS